MGDFGRMKTSVSPLKRKGYLKFTNVVVMSSTSSFHMVLFLRKKFAANFYITPSLQLTVNLLFGKLSP